MRERLEQRLQELKTEFGDGERALQDLETQVTTVRQTLLRISGAIQVLEEELGHTEQSGRDDGHEPSVNSRETGAAAGPVGGPGA